MPTPLRVAAVSYANTLPLVWGLLHGPQATAVEVSFSVPAICAGKLALGEADIGIVPTATLPELALPWLPDTGIACRGPVRSILLISKIPPNRINTLAVDQSSRTSVQLARIILRERYDSQPAIQSLPPDLPSMLETCDAALIIGDPALRLDPETLPFTVLDLGSEWVAHTRLPMVFAVWAGRPEIIAAPGIRELFLESCRYGLDRLNDIIEIASRDRNFPPELLRSYLTKNICFELSDRDREGMALYLRKLG